MSSILPTLTHNAYVSFSILHHIMYIPLHHQTALEDTGPIINSSLNPSGYLGAHSRYPVFLKRRERARKGKKEREKSVYTNKPKGGSESGGKLPQMEGKGQKGNC